MRIRCNDLANTGPRVSILVMQDFSTNSTSAPHPWGWLDRLGMGMALVCAVHCLLTPILVVLLPIIATSFWVDQSFHLWMLAIVAPMTAFSFFMGCRKHHDGLLILLAGVGLVLLITGISVGCSSCDSHNHAHSIFDLDSFPHSLESLLTTLGGLTLVIAHFRNFRLCRHTNCKHSH